MFGNLKCRHGLAAVEPTVEKYLVQGARKMAIVEGSWLMPPHIARVHNNRMTAAKMLAGRSRDALRGSL
jgi:hypothetical protein